MSVSKIPMVGEKTYHTLRQMGIEKILTLQQMPIELMYDVFGENGKTIWQKAVMVRGIFYLIFHLLEVNADHGVLLF